MKIDHLFISKVSLNKAFWMDIYSNLIQLMSQSKTTKTKVTNNNEEEKKQFVFQNP